eukprot:7500381-Lingulodinium_polyedra.AAC.1
MIFGGVRPSGVFFGGVLRERFAIGAVRDVDGDALPPVAVESASQAWVSRAVVAAVGAARV